MSRSGRAARRRRGFALFLALIVLLVMTIAGVGLMFGTSTESSLAGTETRIAKTFYAADSGISYAAATFAASPSYAGGTVPPLLSSNTPGATTPDIDVTVSQPIFIGYTIQPRDEIQSQGSGYGTSQIIEGAFEVTSTATSATLQTKKVVSAQLAVYPQQLSVP